jgi:hypothetical protein
VRRQLHQRDVRVVTGVEPATDLVIEPNDSIIDQGRQDRARHRLGDRADLEATVSGAIVAEFDRISFAVGRSHSDDGRIGERRSKVVNKRPAIRESPAHRHLLVA